MDFWVFLLSVLSNHRRKSNEEKFDKIGKDEVDYVENTNFYFLEAVLLTLAAITILSIDFSRFDFRLWLDNTKSKKTPKR